MAELVGIATWNFREGTLAQRIDRFAAMGYNAVSLIFRDACAMCRGELPEAEAAIARHSLAVTIHGGMAPKDQPIDTDSLLVDFRSFTDWQARTGALRSVNFDAHKIDGVPQAEAMRTALREMLRISDDAGFTVGIEDWPINPEQLAQIYDLRAYPHYGLLIDLGHLNLRLRKGSDPSAPFPIDKAREQLDLISLPVNELHVHNNNGLKDMHAPPTMGTADTAALANLLKAKGISCVSTIEMVPAWCGLTEDQGWEAVPKALEFWRSAFRQ